MHPSLVVALVVLTAGLALPAQQPPPRVDQEQPPLTFKVEVNYVEIDAIVTDAQGNFVRDLRKEDFEVVEGGTRQQVSVFSLVDLPIERADAPLFAPSPIEPDVRTNRKEFDGRVLVIVLDDLNTHFSRSPRVRLAARQFIERYMGANDIAAVVSTGGSSKGGQEFTSSRARLLRAVDTFLGQRARSATLEALEERVRNAGVPRQSSITSAGDLERAYKARNMLATLKNVADYLAGVRGRRKAVVIFSEGIAYDTTNPIENTYASDINAETQDAIAAATRANVSFYGVDPRGLSAFDEAIEMQSLPEDNSLGLSTLAREAQIAQDSLRVLSDETGGFAVVNRNDFQDAFSRIVRENSSYYLLGYYSNDTRRDGKFRNVQVRVTRPGLQVRARKGYVAPKGRPAETRPVNDDTTPELRAALDSPIPTSGLGLRVFAAPLKGAVPDASVAITLEIDPDRLVFAERNGVFAEDIEVAIVAIDDRGRTRDGGRDLANLRLRPQTHALVARHGVRITRRLEVPPGRYQLRIGARSSGSGLTGSLLYDLDIPDYRKGDLVMSGLLLASASAGRIPTANPDPDLKEVLPAPATAIREFPRGDTLSLFVEVYDNQDRTPHRVDIKTSILTDDGRVVYSAEDERRSDELRGAKGGYGHTATIPLANVAPGRYVLRVEARTLLSGGATVTREVEFAVR